MSPMIRRTAALLVCALSSSGAQAQDETINVYFEPLKGGELALLNKAIQAALSQPPLQLAARPFAGVLVMVPGKVDVVHKQVTGTYYSFTVAFSRDGSSIGQSEQSCNADTLSDCTDQLVQDVKTVAGR